MCKVQFVKSIDATPEVLLDLQAAFSVATGSSFTPPPVRRSSSWTSLADGSIESDATYADREIGLKLNKFNGSPEEQVANIQVLARLASSPQWLIVQMCGMAHPVFFRTRRADTSVVDLLLRERNPLRKIDLTIPADPFAYGLPESGEVFVSSLAWSAHLPVAKGDVPSPLRLSFATPLNAPFYSTGRKYAVLAASFADKIPLDDLPFAGPLTVGVGGAAATIVTDSTAQAGRRVDVTFPSAGASRTMPLSFDLSAPIPSGGEFRVLVRAKVNGAGPVRLGLVRDTLSFAVLAEEVIRRPTSPGWEVFDIGVATLPAHSLEPDMFGLNVPSDTADPHLRVVLNDGGSTSTQVSIDEVRLVPAGALSRWSSTATRPRTFTAPSSGVSLVLDGINDRRFFSWSTSGVSRQVMAPGTTGGLPVIVPGPENTLTIVPVAALEPGSSDGGELPHSKDGDLPVSWLYFPRYLYLRGIE